MEPQPPSTVRPRWKSEAIRGVGRRGEDFVMVLDLEQLLQEPESLLARVNRSCFRGSRTMSAERQIHLEAFGRKELVAATTDDGIADLLF